jgi:hypothetical protein
MIVIVKRGSYRFLWLEYGTRTNNAGRRSEKVLLDFDFLGAVLAH